MDFQTNELLNKAKTALDRWDEYNRNLNEKEIQRWKIKEQKSYLSWFEYDRLRRKLNSLTLIHIDVLDTMITITNFIELNPNDKNIFNPFLETLNNISNEIIEKENELKKIAIVGDLQSMIRLQNMGIAPSIRSDYLDDYEIMRSIAMTNPGNPIMLPFKVSLFAAITYAAFRIVMDNMYYEIMFSTLPSFIENSIAGIAGLIAGAAVLFLLLGLEMRKDAKKAKFAKLNFQNSKIIKVDFIKSTQDSPNSGYIHFKDEEGRKRLASASPQARANIASVRYAHVLKHPQYPNGYEYRILDPITLENNSSIPTPSND